MKPSINTRKQRFTYIFSFVLLLSVTITFGQNFTLANNIYYPDANMDSKTNTTYTSNSELIALADNTLSDASAFSAKMAETSLLAVELEQEIMIEEWMLSSFDAKESNTTTIQIQTDVESEMPVESWMTDLSGW